MSDYGLNFGFRRSDETARQASEGRFKTPAITNPLTQFPLLLGTLVEIDPANPGYLKQSAANAPLITGWSGLLLQELEWYRSIYESDAALVDSLMKGIAKPNKLAVITSGSGCKIWLKNTATVNRADGRTVSGRTIVDPTVALGQSLGWNGASWAIAGQLTQTATLSTATGAAGTSVASLATTALTVAVTAGESITVTSGANSQTFVASAAVAIGGTAIPVVPQDANFLYPIGSVVNVVPITNAALKVTYVNATTGLVEAVLQA